MKVEIRKLTPVLTDDYLYFFDTTPHWDNIDEQKCYCVCWCSADHRALIIESKPIFHPQKKDGT